MSGSPYAPPVVPYQEPKSLPLAVQHAFYGFQSSRTPLWRSYGFHITPNAIYRERTAIPGTRVASQSTLLVVLFVPLIVPVLPVFWLVVLFTLTAELFTERDRTHRLCFPSLDVAPLGLDGYSRQDIVVPRHDIQLIAISDRSTRWPTVMTLPISGILSIYTGSGRLVRIRICDTRKLSDIAADLAAAGYRVETTPPQGAASRLHEIIK